MFVNFLFILIRAASTFGVCLCVDKSRARHRSRSDVNQLKCEKRPFNEFLIGSCLFSVCWKVRSTSAPILITHKSIFIHRDCMWLCIWSLFFTLVLLIFILFPLFQRNYSRLCLSRLRYRVVHFPQSWNPRVYGSCACLRFTDINTLVVE